jgi:hypothetical protein
VFLIFVLQYKKFSEMEKYERLLLKGTSFAKADEVWRAWYKEAKIHVF